jgi:NADH:ubiquinone oxidoreductase subunit 4 (subunit M)
MLILILFLGVYPQALFKIFDPAVTALVDHIGRFIPT